MYKQVGGDTINVFVGLMVFNATVFQLYRGGQF